jgi:hypothetical protein
VNQADNSNDCEKVAAVAEPRGLLILMTLSSGCINAVNDPRFSITTKRVMVRQ